MVSFTMTSVETLCLKCLTRHAQISIKLSAVVNRANLLHVHCGEVV